MSIKAPYYDITVGGTSLDILSVEVSEGYKQTCSRCSIEVEDDQDVSLNDEVNVDIGFSGSHGTIFKGLVDEVNFTRGAGTYVIEARDYMKLPVEYWIVSRDLDNPWSRSNIAAEDLVQDLLSESQVFSYVSYSGDATSFTFATQSPAEFNLMSAWDGVRTICHILTYSCYIENDVCYFTRDLPEPAGSETSSDHVFTEGDSGNLILIDYGFNADTLRNKVVVYGNDKIYAESSSASPYLPDTPENFYKTAVVSSELIDTQSMADSAASYNLELYNRLNEFVRLEAEGNYNVRVRDTVKVTESLTGLSNELWYVYSISHLLDINSGYTMSMDLVK